MKSGTRLVVASALLSLVLSGRLFAGLVNGGFENPVVPSGGNGYPATIPGWKTTDSSFEIWSSGFLGVASYEGSQFAELNAFNAGTLYQDVAGISAGARVGFQFAHRGRAGLDTMTFTLTDLGADNLAGGSGGAADTVLFTKSYSDGMGAWGFYTAAAELSIFALGNTVRFSYAATSAAGGISVGNFLDAADFGVGVGGVPAPDGGATIVLVGLALLVPAVRRGHFRR